MINEFLLIIEKASIGELTFHEPSDFKVRHHFLIEVLFVLLAPLVMCAKEKVVISLQRGIRFALHSDDAVEMVCVGHREDQNNVIYLLESVEKLLRGYVVSGPCLILP